MKYKKCQNISWNCHFKIVQHCPGILVHAYWYLQSIAVLYNHLTWFCRDKTSLAVPRFPNYLNNVGDHGVSLKEAEDKAVLPLPCPVLPQSFPAPSITVLYSICILYSVIFSHRTGSSAADSDPNDIHYASFCRIRIWSYFFNGNGAIYRSEPSWFQKCWN